MVAALRGPVAWCLVALVALPVPALLIGIGPRAWLDWQPALAWPQPWRLWSAAWVHYSAAHLAVNAAGALLVAALGVTSRLPPRAALAWALAWPLTHALLGVRPAIAHYGGLSGVLHAGVAVAAVWLLAGNSAGRPPRRIGVALLLGLLFKIAYERPWQTALPFSDTLGITIVPFAHAAGVIAGSAAALALSIGRRR